MMGVAQRPTKPLGPLGISEALVLTAALVAIVALHWTNRSYAGALWRDEASALALATMPSFSEVWRHFHLDSVPLVLVSLLRGLDAIGLTTDAFLRTLGMLIGLGLAGVLVLNGLRMNHGPPFFTLALIGLSPTVIRWGDGVRAYGLGTLLVLLTFGLVWRFATAPSRAGLVWACFSAMASVQTHYSNAVFIGAICTAGAVVCAVQKEWRRAAAILGIGFVAAVSMLIYLGPIQREHEWYEVVLMPSLRFEVLYSKLTHALSVSGQWMSKVWMTLYVASLLTLVVTIARGRTLRATEAQRHLAIYALVAMITASVGYAMFLKSLRYITFDWYYVTVMALVATAIDASLSVFRNFTAGRIGQVVFIALVLALTFGNAQSALRVRLTNVDHVAEVVGSLASEKDFVLVSHHVVGITFHRYFKGTIAWDTLPPLDDHRLHRFDRIKEMMTRAHPVDAIAPLKEKLAVTLQSGGRVWLVGGLYSLGNRAIPMTLGPAPHSVGWLSGAYDVMWSQHTRFFLQTHATRAQEVDVSVPEQLSEFENMGLTMIEGWREAPASGPTFSRRGPGE